MPNRSAQSDRWETAGCKIARIRGSSRLARLLDVILFSSKQAVAAGLSASATRREWRHARAGGTRSHSHYSHLAYTRFTPRGRVAAKGNGRNRHACARTRCLWHGLVRQRHAVVFSRAIRGCSDSRAAECHLTIRSSGALRISAVSTSPLRGNGRLAQIIGTSPCHCAASCQQQQHRTRICDTQ